MANKNGKFPKLKTLGLIGVDSGGFLIADTCYAGNLAQEFNDEVDKWYRPPTPGPPTKEHKKANRMMDRLGNHLAIGKFTGSARKDLSKGIRISTPGDGMYQVILATHEDGYQEIVIPLVGLWEWGKSNGKGTRLVGIDQTMLNHLAEELSAQESSATKRR
jgi:hypothetical protein